MSGIVGYANFNGEPACEATLRRMLQTMQHRGPDGLFVHANQNVAFGYAAMRTTPEHAREKQPLMNEDECLCLVFDGRVDNREELRDAIEKQGGVLRDDTDAEMVLKAYVVWGEECPARIIGDFAFAIWDGTRRCLFAARDTYWCRPFFYYQSDDCFVFGSELQSVLAHPSVSGAINEGMLAEYLASALTSDEETLYAGLYRLPASHCLLVQKDSIAKRRYWDVDPGRSISYRRDEEYAEHYFGLLTEAVRCRLRSNRPVAADLSGGLDSSSVVATVKWLERQGAASNGFATFSVCFPGFPQADETSYIRDVVEFWGLDSTILQPGPRPLEWYRQQVERYHDHPDYPNGSYTDAVREAASQRGHRVMLTGIGGDELFTGNYFHYADMLRTLRLVSLWKQYHADQHNEALIGRPSFINCGPRQLVPAFAKKAIKPFRTQARAPRWLNSEFAARTNIVNRIHTRANVPNFPSHVQRAMYRNLASGWTRHSEEVDERASAWFGIEQRHPFRDRRIVEFGFAIPESQRWRGLQTKFIMRQAMTGRLPTSIVNRLNKADLSHPFPETMKYIGAAELLGNMKLAKAGWVSGEEVVRMLDETMRKYDRKDPSYTDEMWALWNLIGMELWWRTHGQA
jgi:asparagine synthase (glutamine-hydrolysing)